MSKLYFSFLCVNCQSFYIQSDCGLCAKCFWLKKAKEKENVDS